MAASCISVITSLVLPHAVAGDTQRTTIGNFGLPGIVDLPTAQRLPDGELVVVQQLHKSWHVQAFHFRPCLALAFRFDTQDTV